MKKTFIILALTVLSTGSTVFAQNNVWDDFSFGLSQKYRNVKVLKVISADSILLETEEKIQLIGIKAPKPPEDKEQMRDQFGFVIEEEVPFNTIEEEAFNFVESLLEGKNVRIEFDTDKKNEHLVTLGYVFLAENDLFVNAEILRRGFADLSIYPPNTKYADILREAYRQARREKRGLQGEY